MQISILKNRTEAGDAIYPVAWFEGLQLLPQHFQCADSRMEHLLHRNALGSSPYHWGVDRLVFDEIALSSGKLRVLEAMGQFPDGLVFDFVAGEHGALEYDFGSVLRDGVLRIALAVPVSSYRDGPSSVRRFHQHFGAPVADRSDPDEKAVIGRLRPNLSLQIWKRDEGHHVQLPLVEVAVSGATFMVTGYHPPAIRLIRGSAAQDCATRAALRLRAAANLVKGQSVPDQLPLQYSNGQGWILSCLVSGLVTLDNLLADDATHPRELHLALCAVAGSLAPLAGCVPPCFPAYDHLDPGASIERLVSFVLDNVPTLRMAERLWIEIPFATSDDGFCRALLPAEYTRSTVAVLLTLTQPDVDGQVSEWLKTALISTEGQVAQCRKLRVKGLSRKEVTAIEELRIVTGRTQRMIVIEGLDLSSVGRTIVLEAVPDRIKHLVAEKSLVLHND